MIHFIFLGPSVGAEIFAGSHPDNDASEKISRVARLERIILVCSEFEKILIHHLKSSDKEERIFIVAE